MQNRHFVSDVAIESAKMTDFEGMISSKNLAYGIVKRVLDVKTITDEKIVGRKRGVYITYDCPRDCFERSNITAYLTKTLSFGLRELCMATKKSSPVLIVGLGNRHIVADSLGERVVSKINVSARRDGVGTYGRLCAFAPGVLGTTGLRSRAMIEAIVDKIKPNAVVLVDALATSAPSRLGRSFQISNTGIAPGSGVGQDKEPIGKGNLGVQTYSIGVPMLLSLRTGIYTFVKEFAKEQKIEIDEYLLREKLGDCNLTNLIVAPKDVDFLVETASCVIANAINSAFGQ